MFRCRFSVRSSGLSVLEVLLVTSIVATLAAVSIPVTAGALDELRTSMAARYLEGRIMNARATAVIPCQATLELPERSIRFA